MSKPTDDLKLNTSQTNIDPDDDKNLDFIDEKKAGQGLIKDTGEGTGFSADWDAIEENYQRANFGSHSHHHRHHSSSSSSRHSHSGSGSGKHSHSSSHKHHTHHHGSSKKHSSNDKKDKKERKKWSKKKKIIVSILLFFFCIIIGTISALLILRYQGKQALTNYDQLNLTFPDWVDYRDGGYIVYYKGHEYTFNKNVGTFLFMGVDNRKFKKNDKIGNAGQADALFLLTYDVSTSKMRVLCLNRDTMTDVSRYDESGKYLDTKTTQLCLAYAFGDGRKTSAENERTAVQRLIYNIPINTYYAIDLSAIKILNDDVGGVTVTPKYTFAQFIKDKTITLKGNQAETFVRYRNIKLMDDNLRRIECQKTYITGFLGRILPATKDDFGTPSKLYNHSKKFTVTNVDSSVLAYAVMDMAFNYNGFEMINTKGEYKKVAGDASAEYFLKEVPFFETILDIFYTQTG